MIWSIFKWIGIIILTIWILGFLKNLFLYFLYSHNKGYKNAVDTEKAKQMINTVSEKQKEDELRRLEKLAVLTNLWTQTAQYYYYYYEKGTILTDYAYMLDLLTQQIIVLLGGDYKVFRNQITDILKDKSIKQITDKGITPLPKDLKPGDFENRTLSDDDINKILDEWEKKFKKDNPNDKSKEDK